jgi:hypothetical protein
VLATGTFAAITSSQVCLVAWSQTQNRHSPVSREMILMMGGRSLAKVPGPFRLLARRRGGSSGSGWGVLVFPRVLVQFVGLKGSAGHDASRRGGVQVGLDALPQGMQLFA